MDYLIIFQESYFLSEPYVNPKRKQFPNDVTFVYFK